MKKLMFVAAVAAAMTGVCEVSSQNVVGYARHNVKAGIYYTVPEFQGLNTADGGVTLGNLVPSGEFICGVDMLTLKNNGNKFIIKKDGVPTGLQSVFQYYNQAYYDDYIALDEDILANPGKYGIDPGDTETLDAIREELAMYKSLIPGWYLIDDVSDPTNPMPAWDFGAFNDYPLGLGMGFFMTTNLGALLQSAGEVASEDLYLPVKAGIYYTGNCTPVPRTLGELVPGGEFIFGVDMLTMKDNGNKFIVKDNEGKSTGLQSVFQYYNQTYYDDYIALDEDILANPGKYGINPGDTETLDAIRAELAMYQSLIPGWYLIDDVSDPTNPMPAWDAGIFNWYPVPAGYAFFMTTNLGATLKCPKAL